MSIQKNKKKLTQSHINPKSGFPICLCCYGIVFTLLILNVNNVYAQEKRRRDHRRADRFAVTCINNRTAKNISLVFKWGTGEWQSASIKSNGSHWFSWKYQPGSYSSPQLKVKFDRNLGRGIEYKTYDLKRYRSPKKSCENGYKYHFGIDRHGKLELYDSR